MNNNNNWWSALKRYLEEVPGVTNRSESVSKELPAHLHFVRSLCDGLCRSDASPLGSSVANLEPLLHREQKYDLRFLAGRLNLMLNGRDISDELKIKPAFSKKTAVVSTFIYTTEVCPVQFSCELFWDAATQQNLTEDVAGFPLEMNLTHSVNDEDSHNLSLYLFPFPVTDPETALKHLYMIEKGAKDSYDDYLPRYEMEGNFPNNFVLNKYIYDEVGRLCLDTSKAYYNLGRITIDDGQETWIYGHNEVNEILHDKTPPKYSNPVRKLATQGLIA
jgi:hypothetical protein